MIAHAGFPALKEANFNMKKKYLDVKTIVFTGAMAAIIYVVTLFRFPLLGSKVHFANAMCLLSGLFLGPVWGGVAAGLGSAIYDAFGGYDLINTLVTFVSKFAMAYVCALIAGKPSAKPGYVRTLIACAAGALTYVALYMLKTFVFQAFVYAFPMQTVWATMLSKLPASLLNAAVAIVAAPIFYHASLPALKGMLK